MKGDEVKREPLGREDAVNAALGVSAGKAESGAVASAAQGASMNEVGNGAAAGARQGVPADRTGSKIMKMTAKELTAEIDRITEETAAGQRTPVETSLGTLGNTVGNFGEKGYGKAGVGENANVAQFLETEKRAEDSTNFIKREVEIENGYATEAMEGESTVGAESAVQAAEWQRDDDEDIANEQGLNGRYVKNLMDRNRKRITAETMGAIERMIADNETYPGRLAREANKARTDFLAGVFNRILGQRN